MITLKRRNLILLLVVVLAIGGVTTGAWMKAKSIINDNIGISQKQYEEYLGLKEDYGDIEELKRLIEEKYYVPVDENELEEGLRKGLFWGIGDPYSAYLSKEEYDALMIATRSRARLRSPLPIVSSPCSSKSLASPCATLKATPQPDSSRSG